MKVTVEGMLTDMRLSQKEKALAPIEVTPSLTTTLVIDDLNENHGLSVEEKISVIFPEPEIVRVLEVELKYHVKLSPHSPYSSRTLEAYTPMSSRARFILNVVFFNTFTVFTDCNTALTLGNCKNPTFIVTLIFNTSI